MAHYPLSQNFLDLPFGVLAAGHRRQTQARQGSYVARFRRLALAQTLLTLHTLPASHVPLLQLYLSDLAHPRKAREPDLVFAPLLKACRTPFDS